MKRKNRIIVSAVLLSQDEKILLGKVRAGGVYPNCWHIPGGGVEAGETKHAALIREIQEEVGIDISTFPTQLLSDSDTGETEKTDKVTGETFLVTMHFNTYQVTLPHNADDLHITLNDDLREYTWVPRKELKNYTHTPPSLKLFTALGWM
jgi:mutator protein MutT